MARTRIELTIEGWEPLYKAAKRLDKKATTRVVRNAFRAGSNVIKREAVRSAPIDYNVLAPSHGVRVKVYLNTGVVVAYIGPKSGVVERTAARKQVPANYAHLVHGGTKPHKIGPRTSGGAMIIGGRAVTQTVEHPGAAANPYLREAFERKRSEVNAKVSKSIARSIEREFKKLGA